MRTCSEWRYRVRGSKDDMGENRINTRDRGK